VFGAVPLPGQSALEMQKSVRAEIERIGRKSLVCVADITDENAVKGMFDEIAARLGRVDILVNNAADRGITPFTEMTTAQWRHILAIVLDGSFFCSRAAIPLMLKNGWGRIVNISGLSHHAPNYLGRVHVSTAKAGLEGFTRGLAAELAKKNITVNCVCPGRIGGERSSTSHEMPDPGMVPPVGHLGVSEDIAGAVHYLCLPGSGFVTGHTLHVNGGQILL
jgi:3-oxoacyl-[acyl-carrier protein] reductase